MERLSLNILALLILLLSKDVLTLGRDTLPKRVCNFTTTTEGRYTLPSFERFDSGKIACGIQISLPARMKNKVIKIEFLSLNIGEYSVNEGKCDENNYMTIIDGDNWRQRPQQSFHRGFDI